MRQAREVQDLLAVRELTGVIVNELAGVNIASKVAESINDAELVLIFGTKTYGAPGTVSFSTREELQFIKQTNKPFFLIKMCNEFEDPLTKFYLHDGIAYEAWNPNNPMPAGLIDKIVARYTQIINAKVIIWVVVFLFYL